MTSRDKAIKQAAKEYCDKEYGNNGTDEYDRCFETGARWADENPVTLIINESVLVSKNEVAEILDYQKTVNRYAELQAKLKIATEALEYYANHESIIKEAYHSNDEKQITCIHTFIGYKAKEALRRIRE